VVCTKRSSSDSMCAVNWWTCTRFWKAVECEAAWDFDCQQQYIISPVMLACDVSWDWGSFSWLIHWKNIQFEDPWIYHLYYGMLGLGSWTNFSLTTRNSISSTSKKWRRGTFQTFITYLFLKELPDQIYSWIVCWNFGVCREQKQTKDWDAWICQLGRSGKVPNAHSEPFHVGHIVIITCMCGDENGFTCFWLWV
jgi:hypothetical protein